MRGCCVLLALALASATVASDPGQNHLWDRQIAAEGIPYRPTLGPEVRIVPGTQLPNATELQYSNNNMAIYIYGEHLFLGFRTAPSHFASKRTELQVVSRNASAPIDGAWDYEATVSLGSDCREPNFYTDGAGDLVFFWFEAGTNPLAFEPQFMWRIVRDVVSGQWSEPAIWASEKEVPWHIEPSVDGFLYISSYRGNHYSGSEIPDVRAFLNVSRDGGATWEPAPGTVEGPDGGHAYRGGVSEVGFTFDLDGGLWGVTRNEDGDATGWGSHVVYGPPGTPGAWKLFPEQTKCYPDIYESPKLFRHGEDIYLIARTDPDGPYDRGRDDLDFTQQRLVNLVSYSLRAHGTGLWRVNRSDGTLQFLADLPGCGDTAFPSIVRTGKHTFLVANYTNPTEVCPGWTWLRGQISLEGTLVYFIEIEFVPE